MKVDSPCINVCQIDEKKSYCTGCLRTLEEISNWQSYSEKKKKYIEIIIFFIMNKPKKLKFKRLLCIH